MTLAARVIPCLDVAAGRVVKGVNFRDLRDMGDPVELAAHYAAQGADEITFLDVTATVDARSTTYDVVQRTAEQVFVPLTVGGGVRDVEDVARLLGVGADKVGVNSAAIARPDLIGEIADRFGAQVLVLSLDVKGGTGTRSGYAITTHGGRTETTLDALDWAREAIERGAGELLVNSIDADGTKDGFDLELVRLMREVSSVPVIASGGAGTVEHFAPAIAAGADAVLAASVFHSGQLTVGDVKDALDAAGVVVRHGVSVRRGVNDGLGARGQGGPNS
ncbi:imidazole glycerol phosphate synthase subunit HisF [Microbacterium alcoholitolerans]|uniref:imidazole glycerol phosphate synthase subunit HisF n=1 Tax=unclassified Microbacterium TaxID=2609290 RepID=UPI003D162ADC